MPLVYNLSTHSLRDIQQVPPGGEGGMDKEDAPAASDTAATALPETDTGITQSVPGTPIPNSGGPASPNGATDSGAHPRTGYSTSIFNYDEPEVSDDDIPVPARKRKRNSTHIDYLADIENGAGSSDPPGWTSKGTQGPIGRGHDVKQGVPIGVWLLSEEPNDDRKHVLFCFLDPKGALRGRKYRERKDGTKYTGNFPSGTGTWAAKADEWLLDSHLKELTRRELAEYVRVRGATWQSDESLEDRDALNESAVTEAKATVVDATASEPAPKSDNKAGSVRESKQGRPRKANGAGFGNGALRKSLGTPSLNIGSTAKDSDWNYTPSGREARREARAANATGLSTKAPGLSTKAPGESSMASPPPRFTPNTKPSTISSPNASMVPRNTWSKYVIKGKDVLIGYWKESSEPTTINKHAMYGVIQARGVFRAKVVPETRDGRYLKGGNYPKQTGGCWVNLDTCVLEPHLKDLIRTEIEEYCRICVTDPEYNGGNQGWAINRAVEGAKRRVAKKAVAKGMDIIEYNRRRCDQLDKGAMAREAEKMRRNGEVVVFPPKAERKPMAKRSTKAMSDAIAQTVRRERKEAKEARERGTMNSKGDADMAEAMRRSTNGQDAREAPGQNANASPVAAAASNGTGAEASQNKHASAYDHLRQDSGTPAFEAGSANGSETEGVKFYLLDRETQRVKMEKWCRLKPTSQYHSLDREGQRRHVQKHIDQLIERQTGTASSRRPKKRSRTKDYPPSGSQTQPGAVSAPSPLAEMTRVTSTLASAPRTSQEPPASAVPEITAERSSSRTESPTVQQGVPSAPGAGTVRTNSTLRSVLNESITLVPSESEVTPQQMSVENAADVSMVDAPNEPSAIPVAIVGTETAQNEPTAETTQQTTTDKQHSASSLHPTPSREATTEAACHPLPTSPQPTF
ncbi:hypothetical protein ACLOAV_005882 [Pseudogymnoascus australis]